MSASTATTAVTPASGVTDPAPIAYGLRRFRGGSDRYGLCDVCGNPSDTVYLLTRMIRYERRCGSEGLSYIGGGLFGHKTCLATQTELVAP